MTLISESETLLLELQEAYAIAQELRDAMQSENLDLLERAIEAGKKAAVDGGLLEAAIMTAKELAHEGHLVETILKAMTAHDADTLEHRLKDFQTIRMTKEREAILEGAKGVLLAFNVELVDVSNLFILC